jgi:two-component system chemotaxis response regulator CheB
VIVTGSTNVAEVERSMQALRAGALAAIEKPPGPAAVHHDEAARNLIETVKAMSQVKVVKRRRLEMPNKVAASALERRGGQPQIVAIAASTGGPQAVQRLLAGLAAGFPLPILVVQHLSPGFTAGFVTWLSATIPLPVKLPAADDALKAGTVYFAPENRHLGVSNSGRIVLSDDPPIGGFRPAGTFLFDSVARAFGPSVVALILTGMGQDGLEGLRTVRNAGGLVMAQDEASCVVFGMPRAAIEAGLADVVLPLEGMADELIACVSRSGT